VQVALALAPRWRSLGRTMRRPLLALTFCSVVSILLGCADEEDELVTSSISTAAQGGAAGAGAAAAAGGVGTAGGSAPAAAGAAGASGAGGAPAAGGGAGSGAGGAGAGGEGGEGGASAQAGAAGAAGDAGAAGAFACGPDPLLPEEMLGKGADPTAGMFTLDDALAGLPPGPGPLRAIIDTDKGTLSCELNADLAPRAVANFVGLARGTRPFKDPKTKFWVKRRFYDGLLFHRVIAGFVAQGGDPLGNGTGGPGYKFDDEITELKHVPGALAYANSGANSNGSQFYVAEVDLPSLDGGYTVFGLCSPVSVVTALTSVATSSKDDKPVTPLPIVAVTVTRCAPETP
jgi:peptidyl-prolyl cis-trans isomerase A (cyclophilin A)